MRIQSLIILYVAFSSAVTLANKQDYEELKAIGGLNPTFFGSTSVCALIGGILAMKPNCLTHMYKDGNENSNKINKKRTDDAEKIYQIFLETMSPEDAGTEAHLEELADRVSINSFRLSTYLRNNYVKTHLPTRSWESTSFEDFEKFLNSNRMEISLNPYFPFASQTSSVDDTQHSIR